jgi:hypothetical protein
MKRKRKNCRQEAGQRIAYSNQKASYLHPEASLKQSYLNIPF